MTYDEVADAITAAIERPVRHCRISVEEFAARYVGGGIPAHYASALAGMDQAIADGSEDQTTTEVEQIMGRPATSLRAFVPRTAIFSAGISSSALHGTDTWKIR